MFDCLISRGAGQQQQPERFPLTGTIEEIGKDIKRIKEMGIEHIIFTFVGLELDKVIDTLHKPYSDCVIVLASNTTLYRI